MEFEKMTFMECREIKNKAIKENNFILAREARKWETDKKGLKLNQPIIWTLQLSAQE
jgi:hypothetical protein